MAARPRRRFFSREVIQTSGMDCGPAVLNSLLDGFGIQANYGRLREACRTDVDGTSIDTLEELAQEAGLDAQQVMLPLDHVLLTASRTFPSIAVVRNASGGAHFVLAWRRIGTFVQVMDPARGRVWTHTRSFLNHLVVHTMRVPAAAWREWAGSASFLEPFRERLRAIGLGPADVDARLAACLTDPGWRSIAALDAAVRMVASLQASQAVSHRDGPRVLAGLLNPDWDQQRANISEVYWSVQAGAPNDESRLSLRGVVLVKVNGRKAAGSPGTEPVRRAPALTAALAESSPRPLHEAWNVCRQIGLLTPVIALLAMILAVVSTVFEATLLRSVVDIGSLLSTIEQRIGAGVALLAFAGALLGVELVMALAERRIGIGLEGRLRVAFLDRIPQLSDAYFHTRPISDMLERSHAIHTIRTMPRLGVRFLRVSLELVVTACALAWINPNAAVLAFVAATAAAAVPLLGQSAMSERDFRARTHAGALARFHLDALLGRTAIEAHGAATTLEREHEGLLTEWAASVRALQRVAIGTEGLQMLVGFGLAAWMVLGHTAAVGSAIVLLQVYWMLNLPALGYELALIAREYPAHRTTLLRLLEPLGAPISQRATTGRAAPAQHNPAAVSIEARDLCVQVAGHPILEHINLEIAPGTHTAIIGSSGAGKSTLVGLLLGWHRAAQGALIVDGQPLDDDTLESLRRETAWVDPTVQLWNRSLLENLTYGSGRAEHMGTVLEAADLLSVVARLPEGLATPLGEGGSLLSAGEAQRVRFGRALLRPAPRLVILDEPFVGLERDRRRALLARARQHWHDQTLLYVTHDVAETRAFDRVIVLEHGRCVEDGNPLHLAQMAASRYRRLLTSHEAMISRFGSNTEWRRLRMDRGRIVSDPRNSNEQTA